MSVNVAGVDGGTISIVGSLPFSAKRDALYWIYYGQMLADRKFNRTQDPDAWYKEYLRVLDKVGMTVFSRLPQQPVQASQAGASVNEAVLTLLTPLLSSVGQIILPLTINSLNNPDNKDALDLFNQTCSEGNNANLQVLDGSIDDDNNVAINIGYLNFKANVAIDNLLFWNWANGEFLLNYGWLSLNLSKFNADKYRTLILSEIGSQVGANIKNIAFN